MTKRTSKDSRKHARLKISLPATVVGCNGDGEWRETVKTVDISEGGIAIVLKTPVQMGEVVFIELPFPIKLKGDNYSEKVNNVYAVVRRVDPGEDGCQMIGLEFLETRPASSTDLLQ